MQSATAIEWDKAPTKALDDSNARLYEWQTDSIVNTCYNDFDRHVEAGHQAGLTIVDNSSIIGVKTTTTYGELKIQTVRLAGAMLAKVVTKDDRVVIYTLMVPEALVAMLACARIGAIHSVVFGGFAAH